MRTTVGFALAAFAFTCVGAAAGQTADGPSHITNGLEERYYIVGTPRVTYSLAERMRYYRVPAVSIAVIDDYRVAWVYAVGRADVALAIPANTATLFQAASMSKPVAAAAILRLFEEKHLSLDADVSTMLRSWRVPPYKSAERVTMRRLLSHSAGVNVHGFEGYDRDAALPTLVQVLDGAPPANSEPIRVTATPGSATVYSGGGTSIAQQVAVDVSGEPFPGFMQQTLLDPLGMTQSTFAQPLPKALWPRAADGYYSDGKPVHRGWHVYPTMAAAGLWTSPSDLAKFVIAVQNGMRGAGKPPIDATIAREMTTKASQGFGLGLGLAPEYFSHSGANEGFQGMFLGFNHGGKGVVVMTNSDNGIRIADEVVHAVAKAYGWTVLQPLPQAAISLDVKQMRDLAGSYAKTVDGQTLTLNVVLRETGKAPELFFTASVNGDISDRLYARTPLRLFTLSGGELTFVRDASGRVTAVEAGGETYERVP